MSRDYVDFWIDDLFQYDNETYIANVLLNINSIFYPPFHTRSIRLSPALLEKEFYLANSKKYGKEQEEIRHEFQGKIVQGAYYKIPRDIVKETNLFKGKVITSDNEFLKNIEPSECTSLGKNEISNDKYTGYTEISCKENCRENVYLYCFNVGQGDTFLLIPSSGNPYIIDTNFYSKTKADEFISCVKAIMAYHNISDKKIKGLIITHKHIDHIRGAAYFIENSGIPIENLLINADYDHDTKPVNELLTTANKYIPKWVNVNKSGVIIEGMTHIWIKNPDDDTRNKIVAPDINDSSICLCIKYKGNCIYMTGDAGFDVIKHKYDCQNNMQFGTNGSILKVSHHGSRTGTDNDVISLLNPTYSFISVGYSKRYRHPHSEVMNVLYNHHGLNKEITLSRDDYKFVCYECTGSNIYKY